MSYNYDDAGRIENRRDDTFTKRGRLETVGYDNLDRMSDLQRSSAVGASDDYFQPLHQQWSLDARGNWQRFCQDDDGKASFDLVQSRSHTADDDIETLTNSKGPAWAAVEQDGNIVRMPQPNDPDEQLEATYDAWNRLIHLKKDGQKFADYEYDGLGRRTIKRTYDSNGQVAQTRHYFYDRQGRVIQEQVGEDLEDATIDREYVWGLRGPNDLILRHDYESDQRLYAIRDAEGNVVAVTDTDGKVKERYRYRANGDVEFYGADFSDQTKSAHGWEYLLGGNRRDGETGLFIGNDGAYHAGLGRMVNREYTLAADEATFEREYQRIQQLADPAAFSQLEPYMSPTQRWWAELDPALKFLIGVGIAVVAIAAAVVAAALTGGGAIGAIAAFAAGTMVDAVLTSAVTGQDFGTNLLTSAAFGIAFIPVGMVLKPVFKGAAWAVGTRGTRRLVGGGSKSALRELSSGAAVWRQLSSAERKARMR